MNRRIFAAALALGALLATVSYASAIPRGTRGVLYDAFTAPPVYHWVKPPADVVAEAEPPLPGEGTVANSATGSKAASVGTGDAQATAVFPAGTFAAGEGTVSVKISPLDPGAMPAPPEGLVLDGNAYRIEATAQASPAQLSARATIALRYPIRATRMLRLEEGRWRELRTTVVAPSLIVYADTDALGTFVPAGPPPPPAHRSPTIPVAAGAAAGAVALAHIARARTSRRSR